MRPFQSFIQEPGWRLSRYFRMPWTCISPWTTGWNGFAAGRTLTFAIQLKSIYPILLPPPCSKKKRKTKNHQPLKRATHPLDRLQTRNVKRKKRSLQLLSWSKLQTQKNSFPYFFKTFTLLWTFICHCKAKNENYSTSFRLFRWRRRKDRFQTSSTWDGSCHSFLFFKTQAFETQFPNRPNLP